MNDAILVAWKILGVVIGPLVDAIKSGVGESILSQSISAAIVSSAEVARARVDGRAGHKTNQLAVEAVHLEDAALRLRALGQDGSARACTDVAEDLRRAARREDDTVPGAE